MARPTAHFSLSFPRLLDVRRAPFTLFLPRRRPYIARPASEADRNVPLRRATELRARLYSRPDSPCPVGTPVFHPQGSPLWGCRASPSCSVFFLFLLSFFPALRLFARPHFSVYPPGGLVFILTCLFSCTTWQGPGSRSIHIFVFSFSIFLFPLCCWALLFPLLHLLPGRPCPFLLYLRLPTTPCLTHKKKTDVLIFHVDSICWY